MCFDIGRKREFVALKPTEIPTFVMQVVERYLPTD